MKGLAIRGLSLTLGAKNDRHEILKDVDLDIVPGEVQGLAGESGSGKTMTALAVMGLLPVGARVSGSAKLGSLELIGMPERQLASVRGKRIAMVFQDPSTSLHPQITIGKQLSDHVRHHLHLDRREAKARAISLLERVRVPDPARAIARYPHQFSGGQRQRIAIAIALACEPEILLADEPTTALDVTVQAGILHLIRDLAVDSGLGVLLVTHDLGVMSAVADSVAIMRSGEVVEEGSREDIFLQPEHEYTRTLLAALPGATVGPSSAEELEALAQATLEDGGVES